MVRQRNRRIHSGSGFFGSFDAPWSGRSWIDLFSKETQNPFSDSFGFKNPILDFLKETHPESPYSLISHSLRSWSHFLCSLSVLDKTTASRMQNGIQKYIKMVLGKYSVVYFPLRSTPLGRARETSFLRPLQALKSQSQPWRNALMMSLSGKK